MVATKRIASVSAFLLMGLFISCKTDHAINSDQSPAARVNDLFIAEADSLYTIAAALSDRSTFDRDTCKQYFVRARHHFKKIESLVIFYFPEENDRINGPALAEAEEYDDKVIAPTGFQVLEEILYGDEWDEKAFQQEIRAFKAIINNLRQIVRSNALNDANVFEAARLEILTIISLGISGFDSPVSFQSMPEAKAALQGIEAMLACYSNTTAVATEERKLHILFQSANQYLDEHPDFNSFDRATFIRQYLNKLSAQIYTYQQSLKIPNNAWVTAFRMDKPHFFSKDVINSDFFSPTYNRDLKREVAVLGKMLFFDPVLSGNHARACVSCHIPSKAFTDGKIKSMAFGANGEIARNAPTLINSGFQKSQFWDQRVHFIEDQVTDVMTNPQEMHGDIAKASAILAGSKEYVAMFRKAFGAEAAIDKRNIQTALAAYIRTLTALNSPFDRYMRDEAALTADEIAGFNLFMGKAKCATCHFIPLTNGTVPPQYSDTEAEVLGIPAHVDTLHATADGDVGKFNTYHRDLHKHAFKTPTVRNAALTAPYMHNGVFKNLEEVIDFYNRGGGAGIGAELPNQTLPPGKLALSAQEQQQIISFIHTLTDTTSLTTWPTTLPKFNDEKLNARRIGGSY